MLALRGRSIVRLRVPLLHVASFSSDGAPVKPQFEDILRDIHIENDAKKKPSVHKLTALFRSVTSRQELIEAAKTLRIYEVNFVDPKQQTAGEFIKAAIKQDAEDLALKTFQQHHRIGMFVSTGSLNNLLVHLYKKKDHASALTLYRELKLYKVEPNVETYSLVLRHLLGANEFAQLLDTLATAGAANMVKANTLNHILIQLTKHGKHDEIINVLDVASTHNIPQNDITKSVLGSNQ